MFVKKDTYMIIFIILAITGVMIYLGYGKNNADCISQENQYKYSTTCASQQWEHKDARETLQKYVSTFGNPDEMSRRSATWNDMAGFNKTVVIDESVHHARPIKHIDFVYSTKKIKVLPEHVEMLANSSGSILVDQLKGEVTARCHYLIKNAVTLGFVEDVVAGKISPNEAPRVYAKRILENEVPNWFQDKLNEQKKTYGKGDHHIAAAYCIPRAKCKRAPARGYDVHI